MKKTVLIAGLGLIGGSMAKAVRAYTDCRILGDDRDAETLDRALRESTVDAAAGCADAGQADLILVGLYPVSTADYILRCLPHCRRGCVIVDLCGIKQYIGERVAEPARACGVAYIGGHPMAGREFSGFSYASADLFQGASMIFVPNDSVSEQTLAEAGVFFRRLGFARIVRTTARQHDKMIAFTSQLAHVVSSAYIKSPEALHHNGYSAGSYRDLTRVARLNETMWAELFLHNRDALVQEIDEIMRHLSEYRETIAGGQEEELRRLLKEGRERKEQIG